MTWATVRSEREFEHERFTVWPCPACRCIHAYEDLDLDLARTASVRQVLQQPDHRHLVTAAWLAERLGGSASSRSPGPTAPTSTPGSRSSTCRPWTTTWSATVAGRPQRAVPVVVAAAAGLLVAGLTGGFVTRTDEVQLIFRRPL